MSHNPSAFPMLGSVAHNSGWDIDPGMDLRDWFAGQALPAAIAAVVSGKVPLDNWIGSSSQTAASIAYSMADAMLAARTSTPTPEQDR